MSRCTRPAILVLALWLLLSPRTLVRAQNADGPPDPLRPADTSSPQDTLRSFLLDSQSAFQEFRLTAMTRRGFEAYRRMVSTLDFSTTPHGDSWIVRTERLLLLKDVLDRVELPSYDEIPGDREVADQGITQWTIPNTRITIRQLEKGPRAGAFLFSAGTVEQLQRAYRQAKHLPTKSGATESLYEAWLESNDTTVAHERRLRNRLKRIDATNPLSTLDGFLDSINRAHAIVVQAEAGLKANPPTMTAEEAEEAEIVARNLMKRAIATLDLSEVPKANREDVAVESALQLKEIFDRMLLPPFDTVPDAERVQAARAASPGSRQPFRWRYPNTEIEIVEITEGNRQGQFLFSAGTVSQVDDHYRMVRDLPYRADVIGLAASIDYLSPGKTEGFYDFYISTPGRLIPGASVIGRFVETLPDSVKKVRAGGETVWQWFALTLATVAVGLLGFILFVVTRLLAQRTKSPFDAWVSILAPTTTALLVAAVVRFLRRDINLTGGVLSVVASAGVLITTFFAAWAVVRVFRAIVETTVAIARVRGTSLDASLLRLAARVLAFVVGVWIVIDAVRQVGLDVVPLVAGLGIGGLAIALAAQRTFANFLGSLILYANKPIRVGDFCRYGDQIGTVEEIGLLSTRIRSPERTLVTVPNAEFSELKLENFMVRDRRLLRSTLRLRYETTTEQMRFVLAKLRAMLLGHPMVTPDPARVRFVDYGSYSKDIEIFAYLRCEDENTFLAAKEDILLRIEDIIEESGTHFAIPAQTTYLSRDEGLDAHRGEEAEAQVEQWRQSQTLPFPEFAPEEHQRLEDVLDYPPEGSPDHKPPAD
ncbi:MAG: mechanosensitive ion channel [Myxococcales bacterium]|nr:mechanosensitive ion channel [Myxococcales bacterium]